MGYMEIIHLTYELLDDLKQSDTYIALNNLNETIKIKYKQQLKDYHHWFLEFQEVYKYGTYHPDFKTVSLAYQKAKQTLFETEEVKQYYKLEHKINDQLKTLSNALNDIILKETICVK